jgi:sec-independent protein translocase protein TatC
MSDAEITKSDKDILMEGIPDNSSRQMSSKFSSKFKHPDSMTIREHLAELRWRLIISVVVYVIMAILAYFLYPRILSFLETPYCRTIVHSVQRCGLYVQGPLDGFTIRLNTSAYAAFLLALPVICYQIWRFVTPGLKSNERHVAVAFSVSAAVLFIFGAYVAWLTFPHALGFLNSASGPGIKDLYTPQKYLSLILALMAIFGVTFEFPVFLVALEMAKVISPERLSAWRRPAIVLIVLVAAIVTPSSDPFSMFAMAIPLLVFYEVAIVIGKIILRRKKIVA